MPEVARLAAMNTKTYAGWLLATLFCLTGSAQASTTSADEEAVVQVIRLMYAALTKEDVAQLSTVTASDFYCFDVGKRMTGDELMAAIKNAHSAGRTLVWNVMEPKVRFEGNLAWATWINRGYVQDAAGKKDVSWLESAVLLKESGVWRIQFFHSTRVATN
jgi:ketosteroid isomerase-like protein